ncbi:restriction endonuclease [Methanolobus vulcani]|uniref:Restriction endonuclease n=1 Tax=Methanolobus vulcani TaxID=38026 RepID=A0A7Z8P258_9EURY|nr:restriction endonuclease [Methanolobus vulcani]TQD25245.1 restriction endonuclease [Methanolobus vulcani]
MSIPDYQTIMLPLLRVLEDKKTYKISELIEILSDEFNLTDEEKQMKFESGNDNIFRNRVRWARTYLKKACLVDDPERGYLVITNRGLEALRSNINRIDVDFLKRYSEFMDFKYPNKETEETVIEIPSSEEEIVDEKTPDELLEEGFSRIRKNLAQDLLSRLIDNSPHFFENAILILLESMGYGEGKVTGKSGDNGIDGIIHQDKLGLETIIFQAKRYSDGNTVSSSTIRDFIGALDLKGVTKGVFITTSKFTPNARETAIKSTKTIRLIEGTELVQLMIDNDIGVNTYKTYNLKKIDLDFFIEFDE